MHIHEVVIADPLPPHTALMSAWRVNTCPGFSANAASTSNSMRVSGTGRPFNDTSRPRTSIANAPNETSGADSSAAAARGRRIMTPTRATSSRGLNGFVM